MTSRTIFESLKSDQSENWFKAIAPPKQLIKSTKTRFHMQCSKCGKIDHEEEHTGKVTLKRCGKCKSVWYCSQSCQRADWQKHKTSCHDMEGPGLHKLIENFMANMTLVLNIQIYCALVFDFVRLLKDPVGAADILDTPRMISIGVSIEPLDIVKFMQLFHTDEDIPRPIKGMFQITEITKVPETEQLSPRRMEMWRYARKQAQDTGKGDCPIVLVEYAFRGGPHTLTTTQLIFTHAIEQADKRDPFICDSKIRGRFEKPMTEDTLIEATNTLIRSDKRNQFMLQTTMAEADIDIIRRAGSEQIQNLAVPSQLLLAKMGREDIYNSAFAVRVVE